jgi:hypothetical protein
MSDTSWDAAADVDHENDDSDNEFEYSDYGTVPATEAYPDTGENPTLSGPILHPINWHYARFIIGCNTKLKGEEMRGEDLRNREHTCGLLAKTCRCFARALSSILALHPIRCSASTLVMFSSLYPDISIQESQLI